MFGRKNNKVCSVPHLPSKAPLGPDHQLSLMLQQLSNQLNLMHSLQQQQLQQQQQINNLTRSCDTCSMNEPSKQDPCLLSHNYHHQRLGPYQNDTLTRPPILPCSQTNFCGSSRLSYVPPAHPHYQPCTLSPSPSTFLSSTQHPHDPCHQPLYQPHTCESIHHSQCLPPCHYPHPQQHTHYSTRMNSVSDPESASIFASNLSDQYPQHHPSLSRVRSTSATATRTKSRSRTDPLPPVPSLGNDPTPMFGTTNGGNPMDGNSTSPTAENLYIQQQQELSWTDIYRQDLRTRPDALASPPSSSFNAASLISNTCTRIKSGHFQVRNWWLHGKHKWNQIKKGSRRYR
ncbi:hypothetical protein [Absidia glauca]|uniref:Uncharacterized protein n=1 Tax=Absidia glauca TaxID=4829 RepID=A0A163IYH9_ABSGL|nr:hypothetical protein [Absidia glauca]